MRVVARLAFAAALLLTPALAEAIPIVVAEFRWDAELVDPGVECDPADATCQAVAATYLSTYSLTGLWDDVSAPPTLTGTVDLTGGTPFDWLPISFDAGYFDQFAIVDLLPSSALTTIFFDFGGQTMSLSALLAVPGAATLTFDPDTLSAGVPEPGTLMLFGTGIVGLIHSAARRRNRRLA
jgi:hypothetical protein